MLPTTKLPKSCLVDTRLKIVLDHMHACVCVCVCVYVCIVLARIQVPAGPCKLVNIAIPTNCIKYQMLHVFVMETSYKFCQTKYIIMCVR